MSEFVSGDERVAELREKFISPEEMDEASLYGFRWGSAVVERTSEYRMGTDRITKVIRVIPDQTDPIEIHVSSTGKSVRVFRKGKELT